LIIRNANPLYYYYEKKQTTQTIAKHLNLYKLNIKDYKGVTYFIAI